MNNISERQKEKKLQKYIRGLIIARINALSKDLEISVGGKNITREQIVQSVKEGNELGQEIIAMQLKFLKDIAEGKIYQSE